MAAISIPAPVDLEVAARPRGRALSTPIALPFPPTARPLPPIAVTRKRSTHARAANLVASVLLNVMICGVIGAGTYVASGFVGNVELEAANRDALRSMDRASAATVAESGLRRSVEHLASDDVVQGWASFNKFQPPYKLSTTVSAKSPQ